MRFYQYILSDIFTFVYPHRVARKRRISFFNYQLSTIAVAVEEKGDHQTASRNVCRCVQIGIVNFAPLG